MHIICSRTDAYVLDRFKFKENHGGAASINRDAFPVSDNQPAGFRYAMQIACSTADTSLTSNEHAVIMHMVEGQILVQLNLEHQMQKI